MRYMHNEHVIDVFVEQRGTHWDWSVQAGSLPLKTNAGEMAPTSNVAENEALHWVKRELNRRFPVEPE
ncbi:hypothetical protein SAMN05414139_01386 [Burkholderia sp. D7]|nr:hypothetical protein SAMN05414139_01386 [Burkholderia sp. D7]